jgi:hypothetical protein
MLENAEFVARMRGERVLRGHLLGDLPGEIGRDAATDIDPRQLVEFGGGRLGQFAPLARQVGFFRVRLRGDGDIFARRHRHGAGGEPRHARQHDLAHRGRGGGDADHQRGGRDQPVIGAEHGGAQPADAGDEVIFGGGHDVPQWRRRRLAKLDHF